MSLTAVRDLSPLGLAPRCLHITLFAHDKQPVLLAQECDEEPSAACPVCAARTCSVYMPEHMATFHAPDDAS